MARKSIRFHQWNIERKLIGFDRPKATTATHLGVMIKVSICPLHLVLFSSSVTVKRFWRRIIMEVNHAWDVEHMEWEGSERHLSLALCAHSEKNVVALMMICHDNVARSLFSYKWKMTFSVCTVFGFCFFPGTWGHEQIKKLDMNFSKVSSIIVNALNDMGAKLKCRQFVSCSGKWKSLEAATEQMPKILIVNYVILR